MNVSRPPLSVIVPAGNRKDQIEDCLRSVRWAEEVIVVDSSSTDGTLEIARKGHGCQSIAVSITVPSGVEVRGPATSGDEEVLRPEAQRVYQLNRAPPMRANIIAFALGVCLLQLQPELPQLAWA